MTKGDMFVSVRRCVSRFRDSTFRFNILHIDCLYSPVYPHRRARSLQPVLSHTSSVNSWGEMWCMWCTNSVNSWEEMGCMWYMGCA